MLFAFMLAKRSTKTPEKARTKLNYRFVLVRRSLAVHPNEGVKPGAGDELHPVESVFSFHSAGMFLQVSCDAVKKRSGSIHCVLKPGHVVPKWVRCFLKQHQLYLAAGPAIELCET